MGNKIRINLGEDLELVAELYNHDGNHPEIIVYIKKDGDAHQDICLARPHENDQHVQEANRIDCIVWGDKNNDNYTGKHVIDIYGEEE